MKGLKQQEEDVPVLEEEKTNGKPPAEDGADAAGSDREDDDLTQKIEELEAEETRESRRKRKRVNKERKKLQDRLNLKMVLKGDEGPREEGDEMFKLAAVDAEKVSSDHC